MWKPRWKRADDGGPVELCGKGLTAEVLPVIEPVDEPVDEPGQSESAPGELDLAVDASEPDEENDDPTVFTTRRAIAEMQRYLAADGSSEKDVEGFMDYLAAVGIR